MTVPITEYRHFRAASSPRARAWQRLYGAFARRLAFRDGPDSRIRFLYYHHVFDDEIRGFERQLDLLARHGEFVSIDDAIGMLGADEPFDGRYHCVTFDDGFLNQWTNAVPVLAERGIPAAFFLPIDYVGATADGDPDRVARFFGPGKRAPVDFLGWDQARAMAEAGMTIGSHGVGHVRLADLDAAAAGRELESSRREIEARLGRSCRHFATPWGRPQDYCRDRDPGLASEAGYASFLTTRRGSMSHGDSPFEIRRLHALAWWHAD